MHFLSQPFAQGVLIRFLSFNVPAIIHWLTDGRSSLVLPIVILSSLVLGHSERGRATSMGDFLGEMTLSTLATTVLSILNPTLWGRSSCMGAAGLVGLPIYFVIAWVFSFIGAGIYKGASKG